MSSNTAPNIPFQAQVYQDFVRGLRAVWREDAYAATVAEAKAKNLPADKLEAAMRGSNAYQLYGWLERRSQQLKYLGRWGMVHWLDGQQGPLDAILDEGARHHPERLVLDPGFAVPDYVQASDTHQHPGATWSRDVGAFVYEWATNGSSFSMGNSEKPVTWFAEHVVGLAQPKTILDLGCSAGKVTRALKRAAPQADVTGVDVAAPLLKLAHLRSDEAGLAITFRQEAAEKLSARDGSVDLVTNHWLFHEMPQWAIRQALDEIARVLRPGGTVAIYDMYLAPGGAVAEWLHEGYAARNNEPFASGFSGMDLRQELAARGFEQIEIGINELQKTEFEGPEMPAARTHAMTLATAVKRAS